MTFSQQLITWYRNNKRDLPCRRTKDPYFIWLSEIIMQQTRIEQGTPYYERFVDAYPTVKHLASADEQEVLKLWQGLGYYSRARNLHGTAQEIMTGYGGIFPDTHADILRLKGVGDYTAAAIASICFDQPHAVMDGNVMRFLSRLYGIAESIDRPETKKTIRAIAEKNIDHRNPGDFNQAMMEFGATVCTPANPGCLNCLFQRQCIAFKNNTVGRIPARNSKTAVRHRFLHYLVITVTERGTEFICLNKRTGSDIWKNMYDFPCLERTLDKTLLRLPAQEFDELLNSATPEFGEVSNPFIHILTHQKLHARFYRIHYDKKIDLPCLLVPVKDIHNYPVPKLIDRYLSKIFF